MRRKDEPLERQVPLVVLEVMVQVPFKCRGRSRTSSSFRGAANLVPSCLEGAFAAEPRVRRCPRPRVAMKSSRVTGAATYCPGPCCGAGAAYSAGRALPYYTVCDANSVCAPKDWAVPDCTPLDSPGSVEFPRRVSWLREGRHFRKISALSRFLSFRNGSLSCPVRRLRRLDRRNALLLRSFRCFPRLARFPLGGPQLLGALGRKRLLLGVQALRFCVVLRHPSGRCTRYNGGLAGASLLFQALHFRRRPRLRLAFQVLVLLRLFELLTGLVVLDEGTGDRRELA